MKNKRGFTLVELLAVIAIIAVLTLIAVPAALKIYNENVIKSMHIQEGQVKDAANLFVEDYCKSSIDQTKICPKSYSTPVNDKKTVCLQDLQNSSEKYIGTIKYKSSDCKGYVTYYLDSETGVYGNEKAYLFCGLNEDGTFEYVTDSNFDKNEFCKCGDDEQICNSSKLLLFDVLENDYNNNQLVKIYKGNHSDSYNEVGDRPIYYYRATTDDEVKQILNKNNVVFGNYCWQMLRTTDTGGVRLIYNGETIDSEGNLTCSNDNSIKSIGKSAFNDNYNSLGYVGYMYNKSETEKYKYTYKKMIDVQGSSYTFKYSTSFDYKNGVYTLKDDIKEIKAAYPGNVKNRHYTCLSDSETCKNGEIYYITGFEYDGDDWHLYYITLKNGNSVEDALNSMLYNDVNKDDSSIKKYIDNWFEQKLLNFSDYLEDSVYCNDRTIIDYSNWNPKNNCTSFGMAYETLKFKNYNLNNDLYCANITDRFSVSNSKAKLKYPIGLITLPELYLLKDGSTSAPYREGFYTMSPLRSFNYSELVNGSLFGNNYFQAPNNYYLTIGSSASKETYVRPVITLASNTEYLKGDGSSTNPYIIITDNK